jgi:hypothetical protein
MVTKSIFKQRKHKVTQNKLTKKKAKKTYKHIGGQNATNLKVPPNEIENQESLNVNSNEELKENNNMNPEGLSNNPETENENNTPTPLVGSYNNPNKQQPETELSEAIRKERGGLYFEYPGTMNKTKENAIAEKLNLTDTKEPGFTSYRGEMDDKIEPKFKIDNFYPKYLSYYKLSENTENTQNTQNTQNTPSNNEDNMEGNNPNPNTKPESSA